MTRSTQRLFALSALLIATGWAWSAAGRAAAPDRDAVSRGRVSYRIYCASCHGTAGKGDGKLADSLRQAPADLTQLAADNDGVFDPESVRKAVDGRQVIKPHGDSDMPVWGQSFANGGDGTGSTSEAEIKAKLDDLVAFLATLQTGAKK